MRIKEKHLTKADRQQVRRKRLEKQEREAQLAAQRVQRPSEFVTHVKLLDSVHEARRAAYCVRARGTRLRSKRDIATEHFAFVKQDR